MKRLYNILITLVLMTSALTACAALAPTEKDIVKHADKKEEKRIEKEAKRMMVAEKVERLLADRHYTIEVDMMYPQGGMAKNVTGDYSLKVKGDTLVSYLPYIGRAYSVPYGGGKGLNFSALIGRYSVKKGKKGETCVTIELTNDEDSYIYELQIFDNGRATIDVTAEQREHISFSGEMNLDTK